MLDNNRVTSHTKFPPLPSLKTLWVNKNSISNLATFIDHLVESVPNLKFLSMLNNDACPNFFNGGTLKQYKDYRHYVISRLRNLETLDDSPVTEEERSDAQRIYGNLETTRTAEGPVSNYVEISEPIPPPAADPAPVSPTKGGSTRGGTPTKEQKSERRHKRKSDKSTAGDGEQKKRPAKNQPSKEGGEDGNSGLPLPDVSELAKHEELLKPPRPFQAAGGKNKKKHAAEDSEDSSDWSSDSEDEMIENALQGLPDIDVDLPAVEDLELPDDAQWFDN